MSTQFSTGVVGEVDMWDAAGQELLPGMPYSINRIFGELLNDASMTHQEKVEILTNELATMAISFCYAFVQNRDLLLAQYPNENYANNVNRSLTAYLALSEADAALFKSNFLPELYNRLAALGIQMYQTEQNREFLSADPGTVPNWVWRGYGNEDYPGAKFLQTGFALTGVTDMDQWDREQFVSRLPAGPSLYDWAQDTGRCIDIDCYDGYDGENNPYI
jgi:hypothetical protein